MVAFQANFQLSRSVVLKLQLGSELFGAFVKTQIAEPQPRVSDSVDVSLCIFNKFPCNAEAGGPGTKLQEPLQQNMQFKSRYFRGISQTRVHIQILSLPSSVTLSKVLTSLTLSFLICKMDTITHSSQGYQEDSMRLCI